MLFCSPVSLSGADEIAFLRLGVDHPGVGGVDQVDEAVAAGNGPPVMVGDAGAVANLTGPAPGLVVLQAAADVEGLLHVVADVIELGDRKVGKPQPVLPLVAG
jgi:hypothetical protein